MVQVERAILRIYNNDKRFRRKQEFDIVGKVGLRQNIFCSSSRERNALNSMV